ncbi:MAG: hypothetical protein HUU56_05965 [Bdellovibrionaceae bacterium]|nr:hypothetical protein [Pseudobdellovibrionaceae bacterium]
MKNKILYSFLAISILVTVISCGKKSPQLQASSETFSDITDIVSFGTEIKKPKLNILFVVDNSGSMKPYQEKMAQNIGLFAEKFFSNSRIDYRIGVVPVYDSKYLNDTKVYPRVGKRKMNALGELTLLKGFSEEENQHLSAPEKLFITPATPNAAKVLKETVLMGVQWGPEAEESFSPVLAVTNDEINSKKNENFYQSDAYLAIIFLTDADDVTPGLSAESFYNELVNLKNGDPSKIIIAAATPDLNNQSKDCSKDGLGPIQALPSLLSISSGIHVDLCSNFGSSLAELGDLILTRVNTHRTQLSFTPDITTLKVFVGEKNQENYQELQRPNDYIFLQETNEILINPLLTLNSKSGIEKIHISAKPLSLGNYKNDRYKRL